jgi:Fic family protein
VVQFGNKPILPGRLAAAQDASTYLLRRERLGIRPLLKAHALLLGVEEQGFRRGPVWVGAPHPSVAWHVGSPPELLRGLTQELLRDLPSTYPASLCSLVLLLRLLQVHPFNDGNGRIARLVSIHPVLLRIGPARGHLRLLDLLWDRNRFDLNRVSRETQAQDSLTPFFKQLEVTIADLQ